MPEQYINSRSTRLFPPRIILPTGLQRRFLETVRQRSGQGGWQGIARLCGVHPRTLHDWREEKYTISLPAFSRLRKRWSDIPAPGIVVDPFRHVQRAGHLGALSRYRRYGNPGTEAGRRKGGRATQRFFRSNPQRAKQLGFVTRKLIRRPSRSEPLAELVGILLGDGHMSRFQVMVYLNQTERRLAEHVRQLIQQLFGILPSIHERPQHHLIVVTASSRSLVEWLVRCGVCAGDKIKHRATIPQWIFRRPVFMQACLRGLIDTDGTLFVHRHQVQGRVYRHMGLGFTSYSSFLLRSTARLMTELNFQPRTYLKQGHLVLYRWNEVRRYMKEVGTQHPHRRAQFSLYDDNGRGRVVAERTRLESV